MNEAATATPEKTIPFKHRVYLGWITDLASQPDPRAAWPSLRLDDRLMTDYREAFQTLRRLGFDALSMWGLYVARAWPVDLAKAVSPARGRRVERLIAEAHAHGLKVYAGLGVFSWGFETIIAAHPELARSTNKRALCASEPRAWDWMNRVVDYVFSRFPVDGVSMQSADQGRCHCPDCKRLSDAEYHALLNTRTAAHIRQRWPGKTIGVNSWGMNFGDPAGLPALKQIGASVDYLIDVHDTSHTSGPGYRKRLIGELGARCAYGTLGGPQTEPPQHWNRDRWFLPAPKRTAQHLQALAGDGGRACEYFFHIAANPGDELSLHVAGRALAAPQTPPAAHLQAAAQHLYRPETTTIRDALCDLFTRAEDAYFRHLPPGECGTVSLEPLVDANGDGLDRPGPPVYLQRLNASQRAAYRADLVRLAAEFARLRPDAPRPDKINRIVRCLENARQDLDGLTANVPA